MSYARGSCRHKSVIDPWPLCAALVDRSQAKMNSCDAFRALVRHECRDAHVFCTHILLSSSTHILLPTHRYSSDSLLVSEKSPCATVLHDARIHRLKLCKGRHGFRIARPMAIWLAPMGMPCGNVDGPIRIRMRP